MLRLLGVIILVLGLGIFLGNVTGICPTIPGLGVALALGGCLLMRYAPRSDALSAGVEEWH